VVRYASFSVTGQGECRETVCRLLEAIGNSRYSVTFEERSKPVSVFNPNIFIYIPTESYERSVI